jgi:hypothetical protein
VNDVYVHAFRARRAYLEKRGDRIRVERFAQSVLDLWMVLKLVMEEVSVVGYYEKTQGTSRR